MEAVELFAGAGGLGMGISKAGFKPVEIVEWDKWCCDTINENRGRRVNPVKHWPKPHHGDVRPKSFRHLEGKVALVSGGPPCQPFSVGGKHRAHADDRDMWSEAVRVVREIRPAAFIFENVKGLTRSSFRTYFSYIELQLQHPGMEPRVDERWIDHLGRLEQHHMSKEEIEPEYRLVWRVLNAADYGVPQRRERVVFVGFRSDLELKWSFPEKTHSSSALLWDQCRTLEYWNEHRVPFAERTMDIRAEVRAGALAEQPVTKRWRTVRDAIRDLPDPTHPFESKILNHRYQPGARAYPGHTGSPLDEPAKTLKAGVHGVPGGENMLLWPDGTVRYFTVRESARLQTFPDEYELHGSWTEAMRQLGNAVPVELARVIAKDVAEHLQRAA
ncbi:MAG: DNA cytosine methyltransferase [Pseudomonadota bacterium]|nr:DNA cytosine methyltransferase [Sphingomonas sp.]MDQ3478575.1 DNA cytosine methyltransferase [Pseudomonadota bacterium]